MSKTIVKIAKVAIKVIVIGAELVVVGWMMVVSVRTYPTTETFGHGGMFTAMATLFIFAVGVLFSFLNCVLFYNDKNEVL